MDRRTALKLITLAGAGFLTQTTKAASKPPQQQQQYYPFAKPALQYDFDALVPHIDEQTMRIHYTKHHQGYVQKANQALEKFSNYHTTGGQDILSNLDEFPESVRTTLRNNLGGHLNHTLYWKTVSPNGQRKPKGKLLKQIDKDFGSYEQFTTQFKKEALGVFGSGWAWLSATPSGKLIVESTPNQDSPYLHGNTPLLGIDVWEHAYYLQYQNKRAEYVDAFLKIVAWEKVLYPV